MSTGRIGRMTTPAQGSRIHDGALYECDNSKFGSDGKGRYWPGAEAWFAWLSRTIERYGPDRCLWALARTSRSTPLAPSPSPCPGRPAFEN
ncbi:hypothetical protein [Streptomyces luteolus]|uniref:Uncharacterized protein n=1 Tax=Streptomyces luteolus TaxID=3043615 RepID=A0ABT6SVE8_9ACTN|nr:hypothetical protein [Streptomyces sp. B-S-A12]MDI3418602.1 hypothetical protein [Streptomyces sp. B-S-A12]